MAAASLLTWIERLVWVAIYGGLFAIVLGLAVAGRQGALAAALWTLGGFGVAAGVVLIWVRSRLTADLDTKNETRP